MTKICINCGKKFEANKYGNNRKRCVVCNTIFRNTQSLKCLYKRTGRKPRPTMSQSKRHHHFICSELKIKNEYR